MAIIPQIWDAIRFEVDHQGEEGLFILTGSAVPASSEKYITRVQDVSPGLPCDLCHYGNRENLQAKLASANCSREMQPGRFQQIETGRHRLSRLQRWMA